jgi:hypothetical protein
MVLGRFIIGKVDRPRNNALVSLDYVNVVERHIAVPAWTVNHHRTSGVPGAQGEIPSHAKHGTAQTLP